MHDAHQHQLQLQNMDCHASMTTATLVLSEHVPFAIHAQGRIGHYVLKAPMVIGHECAG